MSSESQIAANRLNAQASTGPTTPEGKSRASRNALSFGLYSTHDFVHPEEHDLYADFCAGFQSDLAPEGAVEQTLAAEIIHAAWRLRRCASIESVFENDHDDQKQQSIDRARAQAHRIFHRATSELRRLQTERQFRAEFLDADADTASLGLASYKDIVAALTGDVHRKLLLRKLNSERAPSATQNRLAPIAIQNWPDAKGTQSTARNAECTCGSGLKFKRCCGINAPAVLNLAA